MIYYKQPYRSDLNIGKGLNDDIQTVPNDDDWIVIKDADAMFLTPDYGTIIENALLSNHPYQLIGCYTNRIGSPHQRPYAGCLDEHLFNCFDMKEHYAYAESLRDKYGSQMKEIKQGIAGFFMAFQKKTWNNNKFQENVPYFDTIFSANVIKRKGRVALMQGLYMYHTYRAWSDTPMSDTKHLYK